ncbi:MAG: hypothetical protein ABJB70_04275 [Candidatus Udaeobacter sp.]
MNFVWRSRLLALTGLVAFCAFAGDIVADSLGDACGDHCVAQSSQSDSQHEKAPCSHCSCCVHGGSAIVWSSALQISVALQPSIFVAVLERSVPEGPRPAIDHPPQLA